MVTGILSQYKPGEKVDDKLIHELVKHHPTKKITNVEYLFMDKRPPFNGISLFYKSNDSHKIDDISYVICIKNLFGKFKISKQYTDDVKTAFRNEIVNGTRKTYYLSNQNDKCAHCCKHTGDITVDHYPTPYKDIFDDFMSTNNIVMNSVDIYENECNSILLSDHLLKTDWVRYHDTRATYRMLCRTCNSKFGAYGSK